MEETTKRIAIAVVVILAISLISSNFGITGAVVKSKIKVTPTIVTAGYPITVEVDPARGGTSKEVMIYKKGGVRQATFDINCGGDWCYEKGRLGGIATGTYQTSTSWNGGYYVSIIDRDTGKEATASFRVV